MVKQEVRTTRLKCGVYKTSYGIETFFDIKADTTTIKGRGKKFEKKA